MLKLKNFIKKYFTDFAFFFRYLRAKVFIAFFLSVAVSFLDGLGLTMFIPLLQVVSESNMANPDKMGYLGVFIKTLEAVGISMTLQSILILMIVFFVLKGVAFYIRNIYLVILQQSFIKKIRLNLLDLLSQIDFKRFILSDVGRIQNTMTGEVSKVSLAFSAYFNTFQQLVMVVVYMSFAFMANAQFALLVSVGGALTNILYKYIYKRTKGASGKLTQHNSVFQGQVIQYVGHFKYLKATGSAISYGVKLKDTILKIEDSLKRIGALNSIATAVREPIMVIIIAAVILIQVSYFEGNIGVIIISLLFFYRALTALMSLQWFWNSYMEVSGSLENMKDFQRDLESGKEKQGKVKINNFKNSIVLKDVDFSYGNELILKDINLKIDKFQSIALVGESGSGKSTLANLIAGLLVESDGSIYIDDMLLKDLNKESFQKRIGYVSQDPVIFNDTIYNNVTLWGQKTSENLQRYKLSIKQAALETLLNELPKGEETQLGNNGINLSGGQKQRISIARELYKEIDILILDEATSALDSETEKVIQESIDELQGEYTIVMVAHRLSTIRNVNKIVFMDKGKILDIDTFENLILKQERFKKMVELQEL
ncbi:ABC transporter ATP-binding protein [Aequorivita sp. 609]|uniref:ABC transporter ATP-binding protein n=1 Tax=Aequorivita TaxID=153265 RepID=UPI00162001C9|nr:MULTISPECIES: ABC transporter ATP-binding protein [Aequorivita]MBB6681537.1 ABC transporter ATP-binding protein [Aequorivita sp. 609]